MANKKTHVGWAMAIGGMLDAAIQLQSLRNGEQQELNVGELICAVVVGGLGGMAADLMEPATSSWHRKGLHSLGMGMACLIASYHPSLQSSKKGRMIKVLAAAHGSHLFLDAQTPRGLPWIHPMLDKAMGFKPLTLSG